MGFACCLSNNLYLQNNVILPTFISQFVVFLNLIAVTQQLIQLFIGTHCLFADV